MFEYVQALFCNPAYESSQISAKSKFGLHILSLQDMSILMEHLHTVMDMVAHKYSAALHRRQKVAQRFANDLEVAVKEEGIEKKEDMV